MLQILSIMLAGLSVATTFLKLLQPVPLPMPISLPTLLPAPSAWPVVPPRPSICGLVHLPALTISSTAP